MSASGFKYEGDVKDGKRHGQGKLTWANGDVYEGGWKGGLFNGQGRKTVKADGRVACSMVKGGRL
jgi:hypothetical protein